MCDAILCIVRYSTRGYTPIMITAALSIAVLSVATAWEWGAQTRRAQGHPLPPPVPVERVSVSNDAWLEELFSSGIVSTTTDNPPGTPGTFTERILGTLIDSYISLGEDSAKGELESLAFQAAEGARVPILYTELSPEEFETSADTSYERMLKYRNDLRIATEPLLVNNEAEFAVFARYVETGDRGYLQELRLIATRYQEAGTRAREVIPARDALLYHVQIVNALNEFAAVLDTMARFADDPIASIAVLRAYNEAERHMFTSFNALSAYYASKTP